MRRFMLLMLDGAESRDWSEGRGREGYERMMRWLDDLGARGMHPVGEPLRPDAEGVRVRRHNGKTVMTDGPFVETKEVLGGYVIIECAAKEQAIEAAEHCPATDWTTVEVREILVPPPRK